MGASWSHRCAYTGSPNHDLGARDPRSPVSVDPCAIVLSGLVLALQGRCL